MLKMIHYMVTYGDGIANINIRKLIDFHLAHGKIGTVTGVRPLSSFGEIHDEGSLVTDFIEKPRIRNAVVNGGFFVFNKEFFSYVSDDDSCDLEKGPMERLVSERELMVYRHEGEWACMDTYRDMEYLNSLWNAQRAFWKVW